MRAFPFGLPLLLLSVLFVAAPSRSQTPVETREIPLEEVGLSLVRDINRQLANPNGAAPAEFVELGSELFFVATDANFGAELHRLASNATRAALFVDIVPGPRGAVPRNLTASGSRLFFTCDDGVHGAELWVSDGTPGGTRLLVDLVPGSGSSYPGDFAVLGSLAVFSATTAAEGRELWVTDGTAAGTRLLGDLFPGAQGSYPTGLRAGLGAIWFTADDGSGFELWWTDGTPAGTRRVVEIYPGPEPRRSEDGPNEFTELNGRVLFRARDSALDEELWSSDGGAAGTQRVLDLIPGTQGSLPRELRRAGGAIFFRARTPAHGPELWTSDGTAAGTALVQDIEPGPLGSEPSQFAEANGRLYFAASTGAHRDRELWCSDGTSSGTSRVRDIYPGSLEGQSSEPRELLAVGGALYFAATDPAFGRELWTSDGTSAGTVRVADLVPGPASSDPQRLTRVGVQGFAFAASQPEFGVQPWLSDGTSGGTRSLGPILGPVPTESSNPTQLVDLFGSTFFVADDGIHGAELWVSDGTTDGTRLVADLHPGPGGGVDATEALLRPVGDRLFFVATDPQRGVGLWVTQGTAASTQYLSPIELSSPTRQRGDLVVAGDAVYYLASTPATGVELWRSDGTAHGTALLLDIAPGASSSLPRFLTAFGERLVFAAGDAAGREPWISDGTSAGTRRLADIAPGAADSNPRTFLPAERLLYFVAFDRPTRYAGLYATDGSSASVQLLALFDAGHPGFPLDAVTVGERLFFAAHDGHSTARAWVSDGTPLGTFFLSQDDFRYPYGLTPFGNGVLFSSSVTGYGWELCISDGTELGTRLVIDLDPTGSSSPDGGAQSGFWPLGARVLFHAHTPATGRELFVTDGSAAGTRLVADLQPGPASSNVRLHSVLGTRHAYFDVYDATWRTQLWRTDGTARGTQQLGDVYGGPPVLSGGKVLLAATTSLTGRELYRYDAGATAQTLGRGCGIAPPYPRLTANDPVLGLTCVLRGELFPDDRTALVVVAPPATPLELSPGCQLYVDLAQPVATHTLHTSGSRWDLRFAVPCDPALAGVVLAAQAWVGPASTPLGLEFASAVYLTLGV